MPPTAAPQPKKTPAAPTSLSGFRRVQIGLNVIVQIVTLALILLMVNYYAYKHFQRYDFSRDQKSALDAQTKKFLASLTKPVKIISFMSEQSLLQSDVNNLIAEYRNAQPKFISIEQVDPFRNVTRATEIQAKYKLSNQENVVIVDTADEDKSSKTAEPPKAAAVLGEKTAPGANNSHFKIITDDQMADVDPPNPMLGEQVGNITAFKGEQAITNALIEVTEGKKSTVYYLRGHGEGDAKAKSQDSPLSVIGTLMDAQHLDLQELNLLNAAIIPADASLVMVIGPSYDLTEGEIKQLSDYWDKNGRLLILLNPDAQTPRLNQFLTDLGIKPEDDRLIGAVRQLGVARLTRDAITQFVGGGALARGLEDVTPLFAGATQSLTLAPPLAAQKKMKLEPVLQAFPNYWGETDYRSLSDPDAAAPTFDEGKDFKAPLIVAASLEKGAVSDQNAQVNSGRMLVIGNARFVQRDVMDIPNANLLLSGANWLLAREQLIGIAPKKEKKFTLNLPDSQVSTIFWTSTLALPGFFALLGVLVWWRRRA